MFTYVEPDAENREADQRLTFAMSSYVQLRATVKICLGNRCSIRPRGFSNQPLPTTYQIPDLGQPPCQRRPVERGERQAD